MSTSSTVQTVANVASAKASEGIKAALLALTHRIIAEHYFDPVIRFVQHKYRESPLHIRLGMCASATVVVLPTACFIAMLLPAILGCVLVVEVVLLGIEVCPLVVKEHPPWKGYCRCFTTLIFLLSLAPPRHFVLALPSLSWFRCAPRHSLSLQASLVSYPLLFAPVD
jgi:hypothetical protein